MAPNPNSSTLTNFHFILSILSSTLLLSYTLFITVSRIAYITHIHSIRKVVLFFRKINSLFIKNYSINPISVVESAKR